MALQGARATTHDIDALVLQLGQSGKVFEFAKTIATEQGWPINWLNNQASLVVDSKRLDLQVLFEAPGIRVHAPSTAQMLGMKLSKGRTDEVNLLDSTELLRRMVGGRSMDSDLFNEIWREVKPDESRYYDFPSKMFMKVWKTLAPTALHGLDEEPAEDRDAPF